MKKLLGLLGAMGMVASTSSVVIACGDNEDKKEIKYELESSSLLKGQTTTIKVIVEEVDIEISATSKNEDIVSIAPSSTKEGTQLEFTITAKKEGTTQVSFTANGYKTLEVEIKVTTEVEKALNDSIEVIENEAGYNSEADLQTALDTKFSESNISAKTVKEGTPVNANSILVVYTKDDTSRWIKETEQKYTISVFEAEENETKALVWKEENSSTGAATAKMLEQVTPIITTNYDENTIELTDINDSVTLEITLSDPNLNEQGELKGILALDKDATEGEKGIEIDLEKALPNEEVVKGTYLKVIFLGIENNIVKLKLTGISSTTENKTLSIDYDDAATKELTYNVNVA
ncbi:lipoprotein [Spiroplasma culicicola]|uniref:Lipoprotein n=1 Tax=Spiroplasma culicicola AES-1 TaxID=1276246 RepID=W6A781_9MOLU|nr:lipoprotein [Spiroplasma culicicola]AHI53003.1 hypothetical protein SCULI_v1c06620 [Spiroplasma culicicola AES-1]